MSKQSDYALTPAGPRRKKPKRYQPTEPQIIMRAEMTAGDIIDEEVGGKVTPDLVVRSLALLAIETGKVQLTLKQWQQVQEMVEAGVRLGIQAGREGSA